MEKTILGLAGKNSAGSEKPVSLVRDEVSSCIISSDNLRLLPVCSMLSNISRFSKIPFLIFFLVCVDLGDEVRGCRYLGGNKVPCILCWYITYGYPGCTKAWRPRRKCLTVIVLCAAGLGWSGEHNFPPAPGHGT